MHSLLTIEFIFGILEDLTSQNTSLMSMIQRQQVKCQKKKRTLLIVLIGFLWSNPDELLSVSKDKWFIKQNIKRAYQPVDLLKRNGMGWNVHGDIAFTIDRSERSSFVDESLIPKAPKNWKKLGVRTSFDEEVIQYIPPQSCGIAHMPLFDFKAFCIFAEKYVISSDNIAFACDQNAEVIIQLLYNG